MATRTQLKFDELNRLNSPKAVPYREFFGKMHISVAQMKRRIEIAEAIEDAMLYVFAYWLIRDDLGLSTQDMKKLAREKLQAVYERFERSDGYLEKHLDTLSDELIDVTERHTDKTTSADLVNEDESEPTGYWTSLDRAMIIAENEANSLENYAEYRTAKERGFTKKRWLTEKDDKVRLTHTLVDEKTVDIDGLFLVGDSLMRFPHDTAYDADASEIVNCRCACVYEP